MKKIALFLSIILNYCPLNMSMNLPLMPITTLKKIPCAMCDKVFDENYFIDHLETHFKHLVCNMPNCPDAEPKTSRSLQRHMAKEHSCFDSNNYIFTFLQKEKKQYWAAPYFHQSALLDMLQEEQNVHK